MAKRSKELSPRELQQRGSELIRQDAKRKRDQNAQSQFALDIYTARSPEYNRWGFPTGR